ncbi:MAG: ABC-type transporter, substrate-binding lipoprotein family 3 [Ilumatobacteraceae bacterium]|nr:ABC-type transporter, substrate-binding lipoprotein family 3 [Ilumatobacteraceae bacterium]
MSRSAIRRTAIALVAGMLLAACGADAALPPEVTGVASVDSTPPTTAAPECSDADTARTDNVRSYPPLDPLPAAGGAMPAGSTMEAIQSRGRLIAGVSADTLLFGARNPLTGQLEGFDIDMIGEIAKAIFGTDYQSHIEYRVMTYAGRLPSLESNAVDIVAHTMTINCRRWLRIAFSSEYFAAGQKVLVKKGSGIESIEQLSDAKGIVCAPEGSTNIDEVRSGKPEYAGLTVLGKPDISDCLVAMQQGDADATTGDDTVLAGFAAQDPNTEVVGDPFTSEPYGLGFNSANVDFVQFANAVIQQMRTNGRWAEIYQTWLLDTGALPGDKPPAPPVADTSRPVP